MKHEELTHRHAEGGEVHLCISRRDRNMRREENVVLERHVLGEHETRECHASFIVRGLPRGNPSTLRFAKANQVTNISALSQ